MSNPVDPYPEHAKVRAIQEKSQAIGEFLEWLGYSEAHGDTGSIQLAYYPYITEVPVYGGRGFEIERYEQLDREDWKRSSQLASFTYNIPNLLAQYFEIDQNKLEDEKCAMLEACRNQHETKSKGV